VSGVWLLRHGDTEWTERGLHTGRQDVPLTDDGRAQARSARKLLSGRSFDSVLVSPQRRAIETCQLAGFADGAEICDDLVEWDYGEFEGLTDDDAQHVKPGWDLFIDGAPGGESPVDVAARVDRVIEELGGRSGAYLLVGHGKSLRVLAARWLGCAPALGRLLAFDPAAVSLLERDESGSRLRFWNCTASQLQP
jgi:probable phosphoglycerate mutase